MGVWHDVDIVQMINDMKQLKKDIAEIKKLLQDRENAVNKKKQNSQKRVLTS